MKKNGLMPGYLKTTTRIMIAISMFALISCADEICPAYGNSRSMSSNNKYAETRDNKGKIESPYTTEYTAKREKELKSLLGE